MANVTFQVIPPEFDFFYSKALKQNERFLTSSVRRNPLFSSISRKKGLTQKSLIPVLAPVWAGFDSTTQTLWNDCGAVSDYSGFKFFIQDTSYRIKNALTGYSTPSLYYQSKVGRIHIDSPDTGAFLAQLHPYSYYVLSKVRGTRNQYEQKKIVESFAPPIDIKISYSSDLVSAGAEPFAKFFIDVESDYQGTVHHNIVECVFDLSTGWATLTATLEHYKGYAKGYTAYILINDCTGDLFFDNIEINHSGHNWARDFRCNDINQEFTHAFYQVPKHWIPLILDTNSYYDSFYYNAL